MLGGVAAWLRWRAKRKAEGKPFDKPNLVMSSASVSYTHLMTAIGALLTKPDERTMPSKP